jgi:predicted nucleic acid-binding protein
VKAFLDTNVLVSAFMARGLCADLFRYLLAEHDIMTGDVNLVELRRVLGERFSAFEHQISAVEDQLRDQLIVPRPARPSPLRLRDPDDRWVLASAAAGGADLLRTCSPSPGARPCRSCPRGKPGNGSGAADSPLLTIARLC